MPRTARLDMPGLLQHVIVRGIERRDIFLDEDDKALFVERMSKLLKSTETDCLAWALMSNHVHLLLRPRTTRLSAFMRRLLTGYAVVFNLRHSRSGHLFQNRYKSIVCQEDAYLLELVRYIHLNPLRAGLVDSVANLNSYQWCGHSVILGQSQFVGQNVAEVLHLFSQRKKLARARYEQFVADGVTLGKRDELVGGGLRRSTKLSGAEERESYDARILGSGEFVERLWEESETPESKSSTVSPAELLKEVARIFAIEETALRQGGKGRDHCAARGALCYLGVKKIGLNGAAMARMLNITRSGVFVAARRGGEIYERMPELQTILAKLTKSATSP